MTFKSTLTWVNGKETDYSWVTVTKITMNVSTEFPRDCTYAEWQFTREFLSSVAYSRSSDHKPILWWFSKSPGYVFVNDIYDGTRRLPKPVLPFLSSGIASGMWLPRHTLHYLALLFPVVSILMYVTWGLVIKRMCCPAGRRILIIWNGRTARWKNSWPLKYYL